MNSRFAKTKLLIAAVAVACFASSTPRSQSANLITDGTFSTGVAGWQLYATPDSSYMVSSAASGVFEFTRTAPPAGAIGQATIFQTTGTALPSGMPLVAQFDLGNSSSVRKRLSVLLLDADFSDLAVCTFWLPPHTPLRTYSMRSHTTRAWANAAIYFYAATPGTDGGAYQLDNVSLLTDPGGLAERTTCVDPAAPANTPGAPDGAAMLVNGDFASGLVPPGWALYGHINGGVNDGVFEFTKPTDALPAGTILQPTGQAVPAGQLLTATFQLGNSSAVRKRVTVLLHDNDFSDLSACTFWLPAGQPLSNYRYRTFTTEAWTNATLSVYPATVGAEEWIRLDNLTLRSTPSVAITGTECLEPASTVTVRAAPVGAMPVLGNPTSPTPAGSQLLLIDQNGSLACWDGSTVTPLLGPASTPPELSLVGERILNAAADAGGTTVYVLFTSTTLPSGVPAALSPREPDAWQVLYRYQFNGAALSNPSPVVALGVRSIGHTGGGLVVLGDGSVLVATGDNGDAGEDGGANPQTVTNHLGKILRVAPGTGATQVVALGVRNVQRLTIDPNGGDPLLVFTDIGGWVAEELNSVRLADLLAAPAENFGWGRSADGLAREGTSYIDASGTAVGSAPVPEAGFRQPIAQFGRGSATFVAVSGPARSATSFSRLTSLVGDLVSGHLYGLIGSPSAPGQTFVDVNLVNSQLSAVTLSGLAGGRPDPRFFTFPDGSAGVLLEATGVFYRLTELP